MLRRRVFPTRALDVLFNVIRAGHKERGYDALTRSIHQAGMEGFIEFEKQLKHRRGKGNSVENTLSKDLSLTNPKLPQKPLESECCGRDCPNCVFLVYQNKLEEFNRALQQQQNPNLLAQKPPRPAKRFNITYSTPDKLTLSQKEQLNLNDDTVFETITNKIISNEHQTRDGWSRSVRHLQFALNARQKNILPRKGAYNLAVYAPNTADSVHRMRKILRIEADVLFEASQISYPSSFDPRNFRYTKARIIPKPFERIASVQDALTWTFDLNSTPDTTFFKNLASYCNDSEEITQLNHPKAAELLAKKRSLPHLTLVDALESVSSLDLDFESLYQFAPLNCPRYYTMSSSLTMNPDVISITLGYRFRPGLERGRCCSCYLSPLIPHKDSIRAAIFRSSFAYPQNTRQPIIMIGAGTGIAPFRAFIQEMQYEVEILHKAPRIAHMFYGCHHESIDFLYRDELERAVQKGILKTLQVAQSQPIAQTESTMYVQDILLHYASSIRQHILEADGLIYICGSRQMGRQVHDTLANILGKTTNSPHEFIRTLIEHKRIISETW